MSKIIIFGLDDLLTFHVSKILTEESDSTIIVVTPSIDSEEYSCDKSFVLDFENNKEFSELVKENVPDIIINTMVLSEDSNSVASNKTMYFNYIQNLIQFAKSNNSKLIHFSTGRAFSGNSGAYKESDAPDAKDEYGLAMLTVESRIVNTLENYVIVRYSDIFGSNNNFDCFATNLIGALEDNEEIKIHNHIFNPIYINDLCYFLYFIIDKNKKGIYHAGSKDSILKYDFALKIAELMELDLNLIKKIDEEEKNYTLDVYKAEAEIIYKFSKIESYLVSMKHFYNISNKFYNGKR